MKALISTNNDIVIVRLKGTPDTDSIDSFNKTCNHFLTNKKVIFNLADLSFVGSCGISDLIETVKNMQNNSLLKVCNLGSEFQTIFTSGHFKNLEIYESEDLAKKSFSKSNVLKFQ